MVALRQQIAGKLLDGEFVERHVAIEGFDHPLAVAPGPGTRAVFFIAVAIGIAREVEPVARPLLAVMRRIEQAIDQALVCVGPVVVKEFLNFLRAWAAAR